MANAAKIKQVLKKRKKSWYKIRATQLFNEMEIGETPSYDTQSLIGKPLKINLMFLTNDIKKQNINIRFKVKEIKGDTGIAETIGLEVMPAAIKRLIRRSRDRIDNSIICYSKDGKKMRLKFLLVTRNKTAKSVNTALNKICVDVIKAYSARTEFEQFMYQLITFRVNQVLKEVTRKIYPLKNIEITYVRVIGQGEPPKPEDIPQIQIPDLDRPRRPARRPEEQKSDAPAEEKPAAE